MEIGPETERLFHEVVDLSPGARERYYQEHHILTEVRQELESLLQHDAARDDNLSQIVGESAARFVEQSDRAENRRCGPYRLVRILGRGGMGTVYLAERADGEVAQRVAIKLLPFGAGDMLRDRFVQERQILAALTHAHIARMLDAGHLDNGQLYLAMEYVEGQPIDTFAASLGLRQKIALFVKVCAAVAYLHRNLVVHRDLKPSNILVTGDGEPKLLDFGISKILHLTNESTVTSLRMLTPDYASPEQVTGGAVSTATDIYSLGAVLYRLLTGKTAHELAECSPEAVATIIATREVTRPGQWAPELKGDLEAIVLKALRKDPQERYQTVEQFAGDLEAFLESRPVKARSGSGWYSARKFLCRYWVSVTAAAVVIASLAAGLYVANRQRLIAQRRFDQVRRLANIFVFDVEDRIARLPGATAARKTIVETGLQYLESLQQDARGDASLLIEVARAYEKIGDVQGLPSEGGTLGDRAGALASYNRAAGILTELVKNGNVSSRLPLASVYLKLVTLRKSEADIRPALEALGRAREISERLVRESPRDRQVLVKLLTVHALAAGIAFDLKQRKDLAEAATLEMGIAQRLMALDATSRDNREALAHAYTAVARARILSGELEEGAEGYRTAVGIFEQLCGENPQNVAYRRVLEAEYVSLADLLALPTSPNLGDAAGALGVLKKATSIAQWLKEKDPADRKADFDRVYVSTRLGAILVGDPRHATEGVRQLEQTRAMVEHLIEGDPENAGYRYYAAYVDGELGNGFMELGRSQEAEQRLLQAASAGRELAGGPNGPNTRRVMAMATARLAVIESRSGDRRALELADAMAREIAARPVVFGSPWLEAEFDHDLSRVYNRMGRRPEAVSWLEKTRQCLRELKAPSRLKQKRSDGLAQAEAELTGLRGAPAAR